MGNFDRVGFIGLGTMGSSLLDALISEGWDNTKIYGFDVDSDRLQALAEDFEFTTCESVEQTNKKTDFLVLCVKPGSIGSVLEKLSGSTIHAVSIAAGVEIDTIASYLDSDAQIIRVMPNTPAKIGCGMSFISRGDTVSDEFLNTARTIFDTVGETGVVDESKLDAVTALSGSGPAYVFYLIEAMQEAGVTLGLDYETSLKATVQTLLGASKMAKTGSETPTELRQQVSSPGGTTVEAIHHLETNGVSGSITEAIRKAYKRSKDLKEDN